jgi:hypothetical protein
MDIARSTVDETALQNENARDPWGSLALILKNLAVNQKSASQALPYASTFDSRLRLLRAAPPSVAASDLRRLPLPPALPFVLAFDLRLQRVRPANPSSQLLTVGRPSSAGLAIALRLPLSLRTSFRGHPSDSSFRLSDCPFVRYCFPVALQLAPSLNRSASRSAPSPARTAD